MPMLKACFFLYPFLCILSLAHEMVLRRLRMGPPLSVDISETPSQIYLEVQAVLKPIMLVMKITHLKEKKLINIYYKTNS